MEQQNDKNPKIACIIALICLLAPIIVIFIMELSWISWDFMLFSFLTAYAYIIGLITIIAVRIKNPQYGFGKVVMGMYIVGTIIFVVIIWKTVVACIDCFTCRFLM